MFDLTQSVEYNSRYQKIRLYLYTMVGFLDYIKRTFLKLKDHHMSLGLYNE